MTLPISFPLWVYVVIGVLVLWCKMKMVNKTVFGLSDIVNLIVPKNWPRVKGLVELLCYTLIGCIVTHGVIEPSTPAQALAAGLGWTSLMSGR